VSFVLAYRCGAVPDSRRVPFKPSHRAEHQHPAPVLLTEKPVNPQRAPSALPKRHCDLPIRNGDIGETKGGGVSRRRDALSVAALVSLNRDDSVRDGHMPGRLGAFNRRRIHRSLEDATREPSCGLATAAVVSRLDGDGAAVTHSLAASMT
jgi:hypothetical protein